jgi:DNA polymerase-3 subunit epsilon
MYLFFDTETTEIESPRIVEIAWVLTDENGNEKRSQSLIVRPDGFEIPESATQFHRITTEVALQRGIEIAEALEAFVKDVGDAEIIIGHNVRFDLRVVSAELLRLGQDAPFDGKTLHCTMLSSVDVCKIEGRRGRKRPSLGELHIFLFGATNELAHTALADARACAKCFFELKGKGVEFGSEVYIPNEVPSEDEQYEIEYIFEEIDQYDDLLWKSQRKWVGICDSYFRKHRTLTPKLRSILEDILLQLESR